MTILLISLITLLPITIWGYIFSYIDGDRLNKQRFIIGILAGVISVLPILFYEQIFTFLNIKNSLIIFQDFTFFWYISLISIFFIFVIIFSLGYSLLFTENFLSIWKYVFVSLFTFLLFTFVLTIFIYLLDYIKMFSLFSSSKFNITFGNSVITGFKLVVFYYIFIALIEELSKHTNFLWTSLNYTNKIQKWILYSFFVTLWFVFLENILYIYNVYSNSWLGSSLFLVYFNRSIFSLMVHIFCSALLTYYFSKAYLKYNKYMSFWFIKTLFFGVLLAVIWHAFFDISLEIWWTFMMLLYFLFWYFYITSIFYRE